MTTLTAQRISALAIELLARQVVLPGTVARVPGTEFTGDNGDTITVRVRQPRTAKTQATRGDTITFDPLDEVPVELTVTHLYDAVKVSDEQLTLDIADFAAQVLEPMTSAVAIGAENQVADAMNDLAATVTGVDETNVEAHILAARTTLGRAEVPMGNRWLACSPEFAELVLGLDNLSDASAAGDPSALRDAVIGRYRGFYVVESAALDEGTALAYHSSAFVWGNRAPAIPNGANDAAVGNAQGIALRTIADFDASVLSDVVAISTFAGCSAVHEDKLMTKYPRVVKFTTATGD